MSTEHGSLQQKAVAAGMDTESTHSDMAVTPNLNDGESLAPHRTPTIVVTKLRKVNNAEAAIENLGSTLSVSARRDEPVEVRLFGDGAEHGLQMTGRMLTGSIDPERTDEVRIIQPPKARGKVVEYAPIDADVQEFTWYRLTGTPGNPLATDEAPKTVMGMKLADNVLAPQETPYVIVVKADPIDSGQIEVLMDEAKGDVADTRDEIERRVGASSNGSGHELAAELKEKLTRYNELRAARQKGLWDINFVIGGKYEIATGDLAARVEAAVNTRDTTYIFTLDGTPFSTAEAAFLEGIGIPNAPTDVLTRILPVPTPTPENELSGIPLDKTPDLPINQKNAHKIPPERRVVAGKILDGDKPGKDLILDTKHVVMHEVGAGGSGYGKSSHFEEKTLRTIQAAHSQGRRMGSMVLNPKPGEDYERLADGLAEMDRKLTVIRPGDPDSVQVGVNFLKRFPGETTAMRNARVLDTILNAASAGAVEPEVLRTVQQYGRETLEGLDKETGRVQSIDEQRGIDRYTGKSTYKYGNPSDITPEEFVRGIVKTAASHGYVLDGSNLEKFIGSFYSGLFSEPVRDFMKGYQIDLDCLPDHDILIDLSRVSDPAARSMIQKTLLDAVASKFVEVQRQEGDPDDPRYTMTFEEGNGIAPKGSPAAQALATRWRDLRSAGVGLNIAVQRVSDADETVISNCATRTVFNTGTTADRTEAASLLGFETGQEIVLADLEIGQAVVKAPDDVAVRAQLTPPPTRERTTREFAHPSSIVDESVTETFSKDTRNEAQSYLRTTKEGRTIRFWAEMAVASEMLGLGDVAPNRNAEAHKDFPVFDTFKGASGKQREIINCTIRDAVEEAVKTREHIVLNGMERDPLIERVITRMRTHIDGAKVPEEALPAKAHEGYTAVAAKGKHWDSVNKSRMAAEERIRIEHNLKKIEAYLARNPSDGLKKDLEKEKAVLMQHAADTDAVLTEHTAWVYNSEKFSFSENRGDIHRIALRAAKHEEILDVLAPSRFGGYAINEALQLSLGAAVEETVQSQTATRLIQILDERLSFFSLSDAHRATLLGEFRHVVERAADEKRERMQTEAAPSATEEKLMHTVAALEGKVQALLAEKAKTEQAAAS